LEPASTPEYILKGVVNTMIGQEQNSGEHLKLAQQHFQVVGGRYKETIKFFFH